MSIRTVPSLVQGSQSADKAFAKSLTELGRLVRTSTSSMTAVPKPLKYLRTSYRALKDAYLRLKLRNESSEPGSCSEKLLRQFADIVSVLSLAGASPASRECLLYRLEGSGEDPGVWGHEYVRQLEIDIVEELLTASVDHEPEIKIRVMPLLESIVAFDVNHNAEIQACDLCLEIDQLDLIDRHLDQANFVRICNYLSSCAAYSEETERERILTRIGNYCLKFGDYCRAALIGLQFGNVALTEKCLQGCEDPSMRKQLAFILGRQRRRQPQALTSAKMENEGKAANEAKDIDTILSNALINPHFQTLARELDILEPKLPEEIYKSWLVSGLPSGLLVEHRDSARANLAASFVSAFVHAGFSLDKLLSRSDELWVYKNKDHGMLSATAALGLIHMWDIDGGLVPIDKYLYSNDDYVKSGALLAIGLVNCGVRNECDPALALLTDYLLSASQTIRVGAVLGLGLAYAGSEREDVSDLLSAVLLDKESNLEVASLAAISLGLVNVATGNANIATTILQKLLELSPEELAITYTRFFPLGLGMIYMARRDDVETLSTALEVLIEPFKLVAQTILQVCSYAGTGDVLIVQEFLHLCSEPEHEATVRNKTSFAPPASCCAPRDSDLTNRAQSESNESVSTASFSEQSNNRDIGAAQAIAALGVAVVGLGEGKENSRIFGQIARYGTPSARRAVPLAMALSSLSDPEAALVDLLNKYSHDNDPDVVHKAIFAMGLVGAGTNNARLATMLRHPVAYHSKDSDNLFLVRISEGLVHLGKGTLSLCPLRYDSKVLDYTALAALMVVLVAFLDSKNLILGKSHYLLYCLAVAMEPRWLVTLDLNLQALPVSVRVGQAVDVVGKAGNPKIVKAGRVHTTPLLLGAGERAELVDDRYEALSNVLEGFVILREKSI